MANEVMGTLFGVTPEALMAQREAQLQQRAAQFAQMNPIEQAQAGFYTAGNRLGTAAGGLLGAQDPELMRIRQRQSLLQGVDLNDPTALREAASTALKNGDNLAATQLAQRANDVEQAKAKTAVDIARARSLTTGVGKLNPQNYTAESWAKYTETGDLNDLRDKPGKGAAAGPIGRISPKDFTENSLQAFMESVQSGTPDYSLLERVKKEEKLPASLVKEVKDIDKNISTLESSVAKIDALAPKINSLDLGLIQNFARGGASWLGVNTKDRVAFDSTQRAARAEANNLLLLAKGTQTEGDAQRARDLIADDNTWKNKEALQAAFNDLKATHTATLEALRVGRETVTSQGAVPAPAPKSKTTAGGYSQAQEAMISRWMAANKRSRDEVISYLKSQGKL